MRFKQYSVVTIKKLNKVFAEGDWTFNKRAPNVGDVATVVEIYEDPYLGYELECSDSNGITEWLITFSPDDAVLELIK